MTRLPFADISAPEVQPLVAQISAQRGSVLDIYRMLLHSSPLAQGWLRFLTAIRRECNLPGALRELVILRVAVLNGASYEAEQHAPIALTEGLSREQIHDIACWQDSARFDPCQRAVLAYTDAMTRDVRVDQEVFQSVRDCFSDQLLVELTATIAAYNMVSRFLEALEIHGADGGAAAQTITAQESDQG